MKRELKRDLKGLIPYVKREMAKGRKKLDIFRELGFDDGQRHNMNYYLRRENPEEEEIEYIIMPQKVRQKKYVTINGVRYQDITEEIVDCGG